MIQTAHLVQPANGVGQDRILVQCFGSKVVLAVADGAGGLSGGAEAADMAIATVAKRAEMLNSQTDCEQILRELDTAIYNDNIAGETTCVVAVVTLQQIVGASVGDSGAWIAGPERIDDLTENQVRKPFLGTGAAVVAGFSRAMLKGTLILASDGLLKYTSREAIAKTSRVFSPDRLIALVRYPSGALPDDVAVVLCCHSL